MDDSSNNRALPWVGLCFILIVYAVSVLRFNPSDFFGITQDDSIYFSSAKALANQQGYILPSVPGSPIATKYPVFYPWILSWVWRWNPSFPSNLNGAIALNILFGVGFLTATFVFLRRLKGIGETSALILTFLTALHPDIVFYSASVLSDIPFAALALAAMLAADRAMQPNATTARTAGCAALTGLSILMRIFGVPVAVGIVAAAVARRAWRQVAIFCGALIPFGVAIAWQGVVASSMVALHSNEVQRAPGFVNAWTYYTSYTGFWKLSVPNAHILWAMLKNNAIFILYPPSDYFLFPLLKRDTFASRSLMVLVTAAIFAGIVRLGRDNGWTIVHWVLPFYASLILLWNYPISGRFLLLFLPFFMSGLWSEAGHFLTLIRSTLAGRRAPSERIFAAMFGLGAVALLCALAVNYVGGTRRIIAENGRNRSILLDEKREAYQWLSCCTSRDDVVIAYEDAALYLYSGRQSMRPLVFTTAGLYDQVYVTQSLEHISDVAFTTGARYWLVADDDFAMEWKTAASDARTRELEMGRKLPIAFKSRNGHILIYDLGCNDRSKTSSCPGIFGWTAQKR
jgi:hypothetical protein